MFLICQLFLAHGCHKREVLNCLFFTFALYLDLFILQINCEKRFILVDPPIDSIDDLRPLDHRLDHPQEASPQHKYAMLDDELILLSESLPDANRCLAIVHVYTSPST